MQQDKARIRPPAPAPSPFPRVSAERCVCCHTPLTTKLGYAVPHVGTVGPKCVQKFTELGLALERLEGLSVTEEDAAVANRLLSRLWRVGYNARVETNPDGTKRVVVTNFHKGAIKNVVQTWKERRAEFIRDLQLAELAREGRLAAHSVQA